MSRLGTGRPFDFYIVPEPNSGCWLWDGPQHVRGYGFTGIRTWPTRCAHRISYFLKYGWWPAEIDHKCRMTCCVNPDHLEAVTHSENILRSKGQSCPLGHPYDRRDSKGARGCKRCNDRQQAEYRQRQRDKRKS